MTPTPPVLKIANCMRVTVPTAVLMMQQQQQRLQQQWRNDSHRRMISAYEAALGC